MTEYKMTQLSVKRDETVEIPDGVQILDSTPHQQGVKLTLLQPKGEYVCGAKTSDGEPCQNSVNYPLDKCHIHV